MPIRRPRRSAYSLIELMTIFLIVAILSGVAVSRSVDAGDDSQITATAQQLKTIALAAELFNEANGFWPFDTAGGVRPTQLTSYLRPDLFAQGCPLGGNYDWDRDRHGVKAAVKIVSPPPTAAEQVAIDRLIDDGDLTTGHVINNLGFKLILEH